MGEASVEDELRKFRHELDEWGANTDKFVPHPEYKLPPVKIAALKEKLKANPELIEKLCLYIVTRNMQPQKRTMLKVIFDVEVKKLAAETAVLLKQVTELPWDKWSDDLLSPDDFVEALEEMEKMSEDPELGEQNG